MVLQCCVKGCETIAKNGLHSFPSNKVAAERWIMATKAFNLIDRLNSEKLSHSYYKVCKKHFLESDFQLNGKGQAIVKPDSTPSLFLPEDGHLEVPLTSMRPVISGKGSQHSLTNDTATKQPKENGSAGLESNSDVDVEFISSDEEVELSTSAKKSRKVTKGLKVTNEKQRSDNLSYYKRRVKMLQEKAKSKKINDSQVLQYLSTKFNAQLLEFVKMQLKNCGRSKHGRRYTPVQKSLCLVMYKQGPKSYRFKETWCCLPTRRTLGRYSAKLIFKAGVDSKVLGAIKNIVTGWPEKDKLCTIGWDEVSLKQNLEYCQSQDKIEGFVEIIKRQQPVFATHALTFMVRGIEVAYKQSTGYFYTSGLKSFELAELIRIMIQCVLATGLVPILSVCDTCSVNANAVNALVYPDAKSTKQTGALLQYKVNGHQMTHCYDPSHLIKVCRNNFQTKNWAHFITKRWQSGDEEFDGSLQIGAWDDLRELYSKDSNSTGRSLRHLSPEHLDPSKFKMKVSLATQVFSYSCGSTMLEFVEQGKLKDHTTSTAHLLLFMNDLFDSINGSSKVPIGSLKSSVTPNSIHFEFWEYALWMLENMFFVDKSTGERNNRSTVLKKYESTIRGYTQVAKRCFSANITKLDIRNTTQDGLENFFGCVKSCNQNNKATATQYRTGYATMTINNITGSNSVQSNCQPDESTSMLTNIHDFITVCQEQSKVPNSVPYHQLERLSYEHTSSLDDSESEVDEDSLVVYDPQPESYEMENFLETNVDLSKFKVISNAASRVCQKLFKNTKCTECKDNFELLDQNSTLESIQKLLEKLDEIIPNICFEESIRKKLVDSVQTVQIHIVGCTEHNEEIERKIKSLAVAQIILTFCNEINKILSGKVQTLPTNPNQIQKLALEQRLKKKRIGKYSDIFN